MPFNIELHKLDTVIIKLQIVKNTINIYFRGTDNNVKEAGHNWATLEGNFIYSMPEYNASWIRISHALHLKKHHTNSAEVDVEHFHREFTSEITPDLFSSYLTHIFEQQGSHEEKDYQFFTDRDEVNTIIMKYQSYYSFYKDSDHERLYEKETALTQEERLEYRLAAIKQDPLTQLLVPNSLFNTARVNSPRADFVEPERNIDMECSLM